MKVYDHKGWLEGHGRVDEVKFMTLEQVSGFSGGQLFTGGAGNWYLGFLLHKGLQGWAALGYEYFVRTAHDSRLSYLRNCALRSAPIGHRLGELRR